jgi:hypothetical protein
MNMESSDASNNGLSENKQSKTEPDKPLSQSSTAATNLCIICSTRERAIVFVPCGHFAVCVPCGHGLTSCPTCGSNINALVRIFG